MTTMKMQYLLTIGLIFSGCGGGSGTPVTDSIPAHNYNESAETQSTSSAKFKSPQEAIKWLATFYDQNNINSSDFYGQLNSIYESGVPLGHIFILARLSYVTGIDPATLLEIKEGDNGWTAVMQAFQINGLGGYANLGDFLRGQNGNGIVDGTPGNK